MKAEKTHITGAFENVLDKLVDGKTYESRPPRGPADLPIPSISDEELDALDLDGFGQDETEDTEASSNNYEETRTSLIESYHPKLVPVPTSENLDCLNIIGIAGDNKRILTSSLHFILARASVVNFRYTKGHEKPYFYNDHLEASAVFVLDNNIFDDDYQIHTYDKLVESFDSDPFLDHLTRNSDSKPFRFKYNYERKKKAPNSQSLGVAVKLQHALELLNVKELEIKSDDPLVCIKEGPIFSKSSKPADIRRGLQGLLKWEGKKRFYIGTTNKVTESRVLLTLLQEHFHLVQDYFPGQEITQDVIKSFGSDSLLLKKILKPGYRTPMIEYVEKTREGIVNEDHLKGLRPITCIYHKRTKPHSFLRLEMPRFMWDSDPKGAELAISIAIWQFEMEGTKPLVIKAALDQSNLSHDRWVVEQQMKAAFEKKELGLIEFLNY